MTEVGCQACAHASLTSDGLKCRRQPFDYDTQERRNIVAWLRVIDGDDQWITPGCPSFHPWTEVR